MGIIILGLYYIFSFFFVLGFFNKDDRSFIEELLVFFIEVLFCWALAPFIIGETCKILTFKNTGKNE